MTVRDRAARLLREAFQRTPEVFAHAPGRVNLIGEHTDYNGGFVLPMAIPQTTQIALARRADRIVRAASEHAGAGAPASFEVGRELSTRSWIDYVQGVVAALGSRGYRVPGFDAAVASDVPVGAGVSSSAALEVSLLRALRAAFELDLDDVQIARVARAGENELVGAPVGIMDPMAASLADATTALFIDTRTLEHHRLPLPHDAEVIVVDSGVTHGHAGGEYRERREECARAAERIGVRELRDVQSLEAVFAALGDPTVSRLARRARHVVTENARVLMAVRALRAGDSRRLGRLFDESHASLRDDFEVTVPEVDRLVELAQAEPDVFGARMTGGGFGGAIVALVRRGAGAAVAARVAARGAGRVLVPPPKERRS